MSEIKKIIDENIPFEVKKQLNKKQCNLCFYTRNLLLLGVSWFIIVRVHFIRESLSWKKIIMYSSLSTFIFASGLYPILKENRIII